MTNWFQDDQLLTHLPIDDRAFQYGDGLFETVAVRLAEPRLWSLHMDRLALGCARLDLSMPRHDKLLENVMHALQQSDVDTQYCLVKILLTAGVGQRGYARAPGNSPRVIIGVSECTPFSRKFYSKGVAVWLCKTRLASRSPTAGLKTLNRLEQVLARLEFSDSEYFEGFTMDAEDNIICGTMSNVFFIHGERIETPPLRRCGVDGVMRRQVITTLQANGYAVQLRAQPTQDLAAADEIFLSNSQFGVLPVTRCVDSTWPVGAVTKTVMALLHKNGVVEGPG
jgi:4-amino-4-deoxychorismate lyase